MDKEKTAILRLQEASEMAMHYYQQPLLICYSGGKDSDVLLELAKRANIPYEVQHSHTTADAPETVRHIREKFKVLELQSVKCTVNKPFHKGKPTSMWDLIPQKLMPPTRIVRYCCDVLKEQAGKGRMVVLGVRKAESTQRSSREAYETLHTSKAKKKVYDDDNLDSRMLFEHCTVKTRHAVNPIIDWDNRDVWDYLRDCKTVCNPSYCEFSRVGCVGCPMASDKRYDEFRRWPEFKNMYLLAFERMIQARMAAGMDIQGWETPKKVFDWWMEDKNLDGQETFEGVLEE